MMITEFSYVQKWWGWEPGKKWYVCLSILPSQSAKVSLVLRLKTNFFVYSSDLSLISKSKFQMPPGLEFDHALLPAVHATYLCPNLFNSCFMVAAQMLTPSPSTKYLVRCRSIGFHLALHTIDAWEFWGQKRVLGYMNDVEHHSSISGEVQMKISAQPAHTH